MASTPEPTTNANAVPPPQDLQYYLNALQYISQNDVPLSCGWYPIARKGLRLYYDENETCHRIDFPNPPNEELHDLLEYCRPAVGSRDSQCTLPASQFLTSFDPDRCGLIEQQAAHLLSERWPGGVSRGFYSLCERLDIYGPGEDVKQPTLYGEKSGKYLIIMLPTAFTGGGITGTLPGLATYKFDPGATYEQRSKEAPSTPDYIHVAYAVVSGGIPFYIPKVETGHFVTLTYRLIPRGTGPIPPRTQFTTAFERPLGQIFEAFRDNKTLLPGGGLLGFRLHHLFGSNLVRAGENKGADIEGSDVVLANVCRRLGLKSYISKVYIDEVAEVEVLAMEPIHMPGGAESLEKGQTICHYLKECGGLLLGPSQSGNPDATPEPEIEVHWVTRYERGAPKYEDIIAEYDSMPGYNIIESYPCLIVEINHGKASAEVGRIAPKGNRDKKDSGERGDSSINSDGCEN